MGHPEISHDFFFGRLPFFLGNDGDRDSLNKADTADDAGVVPIETIAVKFHKIGAQVFNQR